MPGGVPHTNIVHNIPRLPNSSAHSHRQHSTTRATTQEFLVFIHHPEPQLNRCYSEPQLKEYHTAYTIIANHKQIG
ncbi:hypothetical protein DEO72_LG4g287 [Vigna unguiculata]|uniref:Uncharacterized protein n=1 Tax=Vigna unguiculata TaxID=3917 RepID=A0A4D6LLG2_VIGUN|nr:hypothetical protein DEO72_LG4g287 [Vigna unguiculata]